MQCSERVNNRALSLRTPRDACPKRPSSIGSSLRRSTLTPAAATSWIEEEAARRLRRPPVPTTTTRRPKLGHCARPARLGYQSTGGAANVSWCLLATSHVMISIGRFDLHDGRLRSVDLPYWRMAEAQSRMRSLNTHRPHPEEARSAVSKDGRWHDLACGRPSRRAQARSSGRG
jgi:hypothetical protein